MSDERWAESMRLYLPTFRLEFPGTYNEYRIVDAQVQFRPERGAWRTLDPEDIRMHFTLKTPVASWIHSVRDYTNRLPMAG